MLRYLLPLGIFAVLAGFLAVGLKLNPREVPSPLIGKPIPEFSLPRLDDPARSFGSEDLKGRVALLNVWATWCVSCRAEHEVLMAIKERGLVPIYGLDYKDERDKALRWLRVLGNPYEAVAFDEKGRAAIDWGVYGTPETFVIDADGIIRHKFIGPLTEEKVREVLIPLLRKLKAES